MADDAGPMWSVAPAAVMRDPAISPSAKAVAGVLGTFTNQRGECWPGRETLSRYLGLEERAIRRALSELVAGGYLSLIRRGPKTSLLVWRFDFHRTPSWAKRGPGKRVGAGVHSSSARVDSGDRKSGLQRPVKGPKSGLSRPPEREALERTEGTADRSREEGLVHIDRLVLLEGILGPRPSLAVAS